MFNVYAQEPPSGPLGAGEPAQLFQLEQIFASIIGAAIPFAAIVLLVMILYGGFQLITSGDNPDKIQGAKNTITYAIAGVVLIAIAYLILSIIAEVTGVGALRRFRIYQ